MTKEFNDSEIFSSYDQFLNEIENTEKLASLKEEKEVFSNFFELQAEIKEDIILKYQFRKLQEKIAEGSSILPKAQQAAIMMLNLDEDQ